MSEFGASTADGAAQRLPPPRSRVRLPVSLVPGAGSMATYHLLLVAPIVGSLLFAAWNDLATRTIPDSIAIAVAGLGALNRLLLGLTPLAVSAAIALGFAALLIAMHARGWLGGGDVKLAAAVSLGLSAAATYRFIVVTTVAGGILAVMHLALGVALRRMPPQAPRRHVSPLFRIYRAERWRIARRGPLPYGIAIAIGGIWAVAGAVGH